MTQNTARKLENAQTAGIDFSKVKQVYYIKADSYDGLGCFGNLNEHIRELTKAHATDQETLLIAFVPYISDSGYDIKTYTQYYWYLGGLQTEFIHSPQNQYERKNIDDGWLGWNGYCLDEHYFNPERLEKKILPVRDILHCVDRVEIEYLLSVIQNKPDPDRDEAYRLKYATQDLVIK